jgi:hypothetical protein
MGTTVKLLLTVVLIVAVCLSAPAQTVYRPAQQSQVALDPQINDGVQWVSINGNDMNSGLSWGAAKLTISAAYSALPPCTMPDFYYNTYTSLTWDHCGRIIVGNGTFQIPSQISIASPFVTIEGSATGSTILSYTGPSNSCAIYWTASPFADEFIGSGGLYRVQIDGYNAPANSCGLKTTDISGFHMRDVLIRNFASTGSVGWKDTTSSHYNEKFDVELTLDNNAVNWQIMSTASNGYTFGYGVFDVKIDDWPGQVGMQMGGNSALTQSIFHMTINQTGNPANADGIQIQTSAQFADNTYSIEIESPWGVGSGHEINVSSGASIPFSGVGELVQTHMESNLMPGGIPNDYLFPSVGVWWPTFATPGNVAGAANDVFRLDPNVQGQTRQNVIDVLATAPASYQKNYWPTASGTLALTVANGSTTISPSTVSPYGCGTTVTLPAAGVLPTDTISYSFRSTPSAAHALLVVSNWPTKNYVNFRYCNPATIPLTPSAMTLNWRVVR